MRPEPAFDAPWHAQLFALSVHLNEAGVFAWPDWAQRFGATLAAHGLDKEFELTNLKCQYFFGSFWAFCLKPLYCSSFLEKIQIESIGRL